MDLCNMARLWIALVWALNFVRLSLSDGEAEAVKSWMPRPHRNRAMMQKVEKQLMRLFGFKRKVNPRETLHIPEHMWTMYRKWSGELHDDTDKMSNVFRILHHDEGSGEHDKDAMKFNLRNIPRSETIRKAELHMFKSAERMKAKSGKAQLHAHWEKASSSRVCRSLLEERPLNSSSSEWEKFDVTWIMKEWLKAPLKVNKFVLRLDGDWPTKEDVVVIDNKAAKMSVKEWEEKRPFLAIESSEASMKRERRVPRSIIGNHGDRRGGRGGGRGGGRAGGRYGSKNRARQMHEKAKMEMCRRRSFYLDFQQINWTKQIISPMGFDMFFCQGTCPKPLGPHMNTTNHAVIQNQVNSFDPTLVPPPCCVPVSLGDQSFLYIDHNNQIVMKTYSDIVVEGCGCR